MVIGDKAVLNQEIEMACRKYLQVYFAERDYEQTIKLLHSRISGFGTASDEIALSYEDCLQYYARDMEQCRTLIYYELNFLKTEVLADTVGIAMGTLNIAATINGLPFQVKDMRFTMTFIKEQQQWLLQHMHLSQAAMELAAGESFPLTELAEKNKLLEQLVAERTRELTKVLKEIEIAAITDNLTGLFNRRKFDDVLTAELQRAQYCSKPLALIMGDVDNFKQVNDQCGHLVGDDVLKLIGCVLKQNLRQVDTLARWGGEEFIVLLPEMTGTEAVKMAEVLRQRIQQTKNKYNRLLSMSFGVAEYTGEENADALLKKVDLALYRAKSSGRNRVELERG